MATSMTAFDTERRKKRYLPICALDFLLNPILLFSRRPYPASIQRHRFPPNCASCEKEPEYCGDCSPRALLKRSHLSPQLSLRRPKRQAKPTRIQFNNYSLSIHSMADRRVRTIGMIGILIPAVRRLRPQPDDAGSHNPTRPQSGHRLLSPTETLMRSPFTMLKTLERWRRRE